VGIFKPPFSAFFSTQDHLHAFFSEVAAAVDLPVFLYDNPVMTKNSVHPETVARLREEIPHLVGTKESNQDCVNLQKLIELNQSENFSILTGSEFLIVVGLQMGCDGFVGGLHNLCPHVAVALYQAFCRGNLEEARDLQRDLVEIWQLFRYGDIWGAFDEALRCLGIAELLRPHLRPPRLLRQRHFPPRSRGDYPGRLGYFPVDPEPFNDSITEIALFNFSMCNCVSLRSVRSCWSILVRFDIRPPLVFDWGLIVEGRL